MRRNQKREFVKMTIVEPFPVFFAHVNYPSESKRETARGPFYAANSVTWDAPENALFREWQASQLRERGWTVLIEREAR